MTEADPRMQAAPEPARPRAAPGSGIPLGTALAWVVLGGICAQILGGLVAQLVRTWLSGLGVRGPMLEGAGVFVPAMLVSSSSLIAVAWLAPALRGVEPARALGLLAARPTSYVAAAIGTLMLGPTADQVMTAMQRFFPGLTLGVVPRLNELVGEVPLWLSLPAFALLPGVSEELVFRGLLQRAAPPGTAAIAISAFAFALFHVDPHHAAGVLPLGLFLAWVGSRVGTRVTIVAHVANNGAAIAALQVDALAVGYGQDEPMPWTWLPPTLAITALCALVIARDGRSAGAPSEATAPVR